MLQTHFDFKTIGKNRLCVIEHSYCSETIIHRKGTTEILIDVHKINVCMANNLKGGIGEFNLAKSETRIQTLSL